MTDVVVMKREDLEKVIQDAATRAVANSVELLIKNGSGLRPRHVNQSQAAEMLNISKSTVSRMVKSGSIRLNKCGLIPVEQIEACAS